MRAIFIGLGAIVALAVLAALGLWVLLPWLLSPTRPAPAVGGAWTPARLASEVRPAPGGAETLRLDQGSANALLAQWAAGASGAISAASVTFAPGRLDLRLWGRSPQATPWARLRGLPFEVDVQVTPTVVAAGVVDVTLDRLRVGRLPITAVVSPGTLLPAIADRLHGPHPAWRVTGDTVRIDLSRAPPVALGQFGLRTVPSALTVAPGVLQVTLHADAVLALDATTLNAALSGLFLAGNAASVPILNFQSGVAFLTLLSGGGTGPVVTQRWTLIPSVPAPGLLQISVAGASAEDAAGWLEVGLGRTPPWLTVHPQELDVDFGRVAPIAVAPGIHLTLLPTAVTVDQTGIHASVQIALAQAG